MNVSERRCNDETDREKEISNRENDGDEVGCRWVSHCSCELGLEWIVVAFDQREQGGQDGQDRREEDENPVFEGDGEVIVSTQASFFPVGIV